MATSRKMSITTGRWRVWGVGGEDERKPCGQTDSEGRAGGPPEVTMVHGQLSPQSPAPQHSGPNSSNDCSSSVPAHPPHTPPRFNQPDLWDFLCAPSCHQRHKAPRTVLQGAWLPGGSAGRETDPLPGDHRSVDTSRTRPLVLVYPIN